ncbi:MAG: IS630 family transposase [Anaerolineae bacterium]
MIRVRLKDDEERKALRLRARREVGRVSERIHFVLLSDQDYSPPDIGELLGYSAATVRDWLKRYLKHGVEGLYDEPRSGRPPRMTEEAQEQLETTVSQSPLALGVWATVWTAALLAMQLVPLVGSALHADTVRRWLHGLGWSWSKPKHIPPHKQDPEAEAKLAAIAEAVKEVEEASPEEAPIFLAQDESTFSWLPLLRRMWMRRGQQVEITTPGEAKKVTCFGALNLVTGVWLYALAPRAQAVYFKAFLEQLVAAYPGRVIYILLDNATIHARAKCIIEWRAKHPEVVFLFLPTYSSLALNPVERLWGEIKQHIAANHCYPSIEALQEALKEFFTHALSPEKALRVAGKVNPLQKAA